MTARQLRRAQERKAAKLARKAATSSIVASAYHEMAAHHEPATLPETPTAQPKTTPHAVRTGLTGRTILLPGDDADAYAAHLDRFIGLHHPVTDPERALVQSIADSDWRLLRIPSLEAGIYALGRLEFAELFSSEEDPAVRKALIDAKIFLTYGRQLNNLSIQENRLRKQRDRDLSTLAQLQEERRARRNSELNDATRLYEQALQAGEAFDPAGFGFEFSTEEIESWLAHLKLVRKGHSHSMAAILTRGANR
jgi:hypothetical protein